MSEICHKSPRFTQIHTKNVSQGTVVSLCWRNLAPYYESSNYWMDFKLLANIEFLFTRKKCVCFQGLAMHFLSHKTFAKAFWESFETSLYPSACILYLLFCYWLVATFNGPLRLLPSYYALLLCCFVFWSSSDLQ